jgi:3-methyladenine DNA glycosylase AlkD
MPTAAELVRRIRSMGSPANVAGMARFGIVAEQACGVPVPALRGIAREIGKDHELSARLWSTGIFEARLLAAMIGDPAAVTRAQMDTWAREFDNWALSDGCCADLFRKTRFAWAKAIQWSRAKPEFVKRAGFTLMAVLAVHDKDSGDERFLALLPLIERASTDERNFVKKAVNWALRQIGKRNSTLREAAMEVAARLKQSPSRSGRWIGSDAWRELAAHRVRPTRKQSRGVRPSA